MSKMEMSGPKAGTWGLYFEERPGRSPAYLARYKSQEAAAKGNAARYSSCGKLVPIPAVA